MNQAETAGQQDSRSQEKCRPERKQNNDTYRQ